MKRAGAVVFAVLVAALAGCGTQPVQPTSSYIGPTYEPKVTTSVKVEPEPGQWKSVGATAQGRPINVWTRGNGSQHVMYVGCVHGDEFASKRLLDKLVAYIDGHPDMLAGKRVIVVPIANPDGYARGTRDNAHGVDINRNFPTGNFRLGSGGGSTADSEPETRALCKLIRDETPDVIITLHSPLQCVDYDGPATSLAKRISTKSGLPVKQLGARPGSLGSYAGVDRRIATVTVELPRDASGWGSSWERMGPALLEAMKGGRTGSMAEEDAPAIGASDRWKNIQAK